MSVFKILEPEQEELMLVGLPNSGKTSVFNALTNNSQKTANFTGTTTSIKTATSPTVKIEGKNILVSDLPGIYSLANPRAEEICTQQYLQLRQTKQHSDCDRSVIIATIAADNFEAGLPLVTQLRELAQPLIIVVTKITAAFLKQTNLQLLSRNLSCPVIIFNPQRTTKFITKLRKEITEYDTNNNCSSCALNCVGCALPERFSASESLMEKIARQRVSKPASDWQNKLDRILMHPTYGMVVLTVVTFILFYTVFSLAAYPMDLLEAIFTWISDLIAGVTQIDWLRSLLTEGVIAGAGGILIFIPQIFALFFLISILEQTGYLTRAACLTDVFFRALGISGKSFVPMLSAHACAIPAVLSTRILEKRSERWLLMLIIPLFSCSARLPVYLMLTTIIFPQQIIFATLAITACYLLGIFLAFLTCIFANKLIIKSQPEQILLELPAFELPRLKFATQIALRNSWIFIKKAGTSILVFSIIIWALAYFPANGALDQSYLAVGGRSMEPVLDVFGLSWQVGVGILASFAARELIIPTLTILSSSDASGGLIENITASGMLNGSSAISLLVFYVIALQCVPTQIAIYKESKSWKLVGGQFIYMTVLAISLAYVTVLIVR